GVMPVPEGRQHVEADEDVVIVVDRIVEPKPGTVGGGPLAEETALEVELRASLDGPEDRRGPRLGRERGKTGEGFPAVQRPGAGAEAVPPAVLLLMAGEPVDCGPRPGVRPVADCRGHSES